MLSGLTPFVLAQLCTNADDHLWYRGAVEVTLGEAGSAMNVEIPLMRRTSVDALVLGSNATLFSNEGIAIIHVLQTGFPLEGAVLSQVAGVLPRYDTADPFAFLPGGTTGTGGTAVYFGLSPGTFAFRIQQRGRTFDGQTFAVSQGIVVTTVDLPPP